MTRLVERIANWCGWYRWNQITLRIAREVSFFEDREDHAVNDQIAPYREAKEHLFSMGMEFVPPKRKP